MKKIVVLFIVGILCLSGCVVQSQEKEESVQIEQEVAVEDSVESNEVSEVIEDNVVSDEVSGGNVEIFVQLPEVFWFSSGAGGWGTELYLNSDGTFYGQFHDSEMGSTGEGYPNGTRYICSFEGKFAPPVQVSEYVYSTSIETINYEEPNKEYIEDEIKYITSTPYGLDGAEEILIYLYGTPREEVPEEFISWLPSREITTESLEYYGIYNVKEETAFIGEKQ